MIITVEKQYASIMMTMTIVTLEGETVNEEFDSQYAFRLWDIITLKMWNASANRRAQ